jgi:arginyl-tRNA synthetase
VVRTIVDFPDEVRAAGRELEPHRLARYACELAVQLEAFEQETNRTDSWETPQTAAVAEAAGVALKNALAVLGIPSPS